MIDSRNISDLLPELQDLCNKLIALCKQNNINIKIISTYRDNERQDYLYSLGRTKPGSIVTNSKAGQSKHNLRRAFDFAILDSKGNIDWNNLTLYKKCGSLAKQLGLTWGGDWKFKDWGHCEL